LSPLSYPVKLGRQPHIRQQPLSTGAVAPLSMARFRQTYPQILKRFVDALQTSTLQKPLHYNTKNQVACLFSLHQKQRVQTAPHLYPHPLFESFGLPQSDAVDDFTSP
jgi:hypothetical protein